MEVKKVNSQTVEAIGYDEKQEKMNVEFPNGSLYEYSEVYSTEYYSILASSSIGAKLKEVVKGKPYRKLQKYIITKL